MTLTLNRRRFLRNTILASSAGAAFSFEEKALLAGEGKTVAPSTPPGLGLPAGRIGNLPVTRLICGGNLFSGFAHSRDLIYVSTLLKQYFTDPKTMETLSLCESRGINTTILRVDDQIIRVLANYRKETGSRIQWIAQAKLPEKDPTADIKRAVDNGAVGVFVHGGVADEMVKAGRIDAIGKAVETIKSNRVIAGVAGHTLEVPVACEKAGLGADFYMKTLNSKSYWSAGPMPRNDSVFEETPKETIEFMAGVKKPWIAYKILGAGAIPPREGFDYAFRNGADFICVGMFDFQVAEDVELARTAVTDAKTRSRAWCA